jgi:hypothetical protein
METKPERPAHVPEYWKWGIKTDTWSFLIKFVSVWKWTVPGKQGMVSVNGIDYTFFVPPKWKNLKDGQRYLFTTSARTDKEIGEITHLVAVPYPPVAFSEGDSITPMFRLVGKLKFVTDTMSGFRVYRNVKTPGLKKKFMVHIRPAGLQIAVDKTLEIYGEIRNSCLYGHVATMLDVEPPANEVQEVKVDRKFKKPSKQKGDRVRVKGKW